MKLGPRSYSLKHQKKNFFCVKTCFVNITGLFVSGNVNILASNKHLHKTFHELGKKYGPIFSIQFGWYPAVVINDLDLLKEALIIKGNHCSDRFTHNMLSKLFGRIPLGK